MFCPQSTLRQCAHLRTALWGIVAAVGWWTTVRAQPFQISEVRLDSQGHLQVGFSGDAASYFLLRKQASLSGPEAAVALSLGDSGPSGLTDPQSVSAGSSFFRVEKRPLTDPLDVDGDGLDDVYELNRPEILDPLDPSDGAQDPDGDGASNLEEYGNGTDPQVADSLLTRPTFSPASGEGGVSVRREMVVRFSRPLAVGTLFTSETLFAEFGGRKLLTRLEFSADRRLVTLFYLEPLPGGARIRVSLVGDALIDDQGEEVDADADGLPGGVARVDFETTSNVAVGGTAIQGQVFASEVVAGSGMNRPLAGVTITVDGREETLRAITDAAGRFILEPCPAGEFFVHVDGRTSPGSHWPDGAYYPFVGKKWSAMAGRRDNLAPGNGEIFLPLIAADALQVVSATQPVIVELPPSALVANPQLAGVQLTVPPNALFDELGVRGGRVGIAPVPPDRLPEPLPPGLDFPLVITVQTDGPQNFDRPAAVRFPNLPDPKSGLTLAPGAKSSLWSFNHDVGAWELAGPMTVTADGRFVESDPGVGIRQPGWHGWFSRASLGKKRKKPQCEGLGLQDAWDVFKTGYDCAKNLSSGLQLFGHGMDVISNVKTLSDGLTKLREDYDNRIIDAETLKTGVESLSAAKNAAKSYVELLTAQNPATKAIELGKCASSFAKVGMDKACKNKACAGRVVRGLCSTLQPAVNAADTLVQNFSDLDKSIRSAPLTAVCTSFDLLGTSLGVGSNSGPELSRVRPHADPDPRILALLDAAIRDANEFASHFAPVVTTYDALVVLDAWFTSVLTGGLNLLVDDAGGLGNVSYALMLDGVIEQRGKFSAQGTVALNVRPGVAYLLLAYDPVNHALFTSEGTTPSAGISGDLADFQIRLLAGEPDADADGLPDLVEAVVGTNPRQPDTDGDGVTDLAEIQQGLDPLGGRLAQTGIVASAETPGNAVDICAANNLAVTANEAGGISVFNLGSGQNPIQVAQVTIPGRALRVALAENFAAVAAEAAGLIVVDLTDPAAARIVHQVNVGDTVLSVASMAGLVCVGTRSGEIVLVELASGAILSRLRLGETVRDVGFGAQLLYALTDTRLHAVDYGSATLTHLSSTQSPSPASVNQRLFVGDSIAYAAHPRGNNSFDLSQPHLPRLISAGVTPQFGWKQIVPNGSGLGVAAVGLNLSFDGPHNISIYNLTNRTNTAVFVGEIVTPGIARAVTLYNGLAYVADGPAGLQVINYLPFDQQGRPPSIRLTTSDAPGQAEAGQVLRVTAHVADDVQVAQVGFLLNGEPVFTDGNFPFEFSFVVGEPRLLNSDPFQIQAIARDTGGNSAASEALTLRIVPDAKAPAVRRVSPFDGSMSGTVRVVSAFFSEPIDAATVSSNSFAVINLGADLALGTADDVLIEGTFDVRPELNSASFEPDVAMGPGTYRLRISAPLADAAGNVLATPFESSFRVFDFRDDDGDLVPDEVESALGLNPTLADTDGDGVLDGFEDFDRDGLPNAGEVWAETDPRVADTDGNGRKDGLEDPDGDALDNAHEFAAGTNPLVADTDHDGWTDEAEVTAGSDPLNPRSLPPRFLVARPVLDVAFPSISAGPGTDGLSGQYFAKPPVVVAVPASANGVSPVAAGGFVARPPVRLTVPSVASGTFPVGVGEFIARPPLQVKLPSP